MRTSGRNTEPPYFGLSSSPMWWTRTRLVEPATPGGEPAVGDSAAPVNAAEAIEALLRVLASDPADAD